MNKRIYLSPPHMGGDELKYIHEAFDQNWIAPVGPNVDQFEKELAAYLGVSHVAVLASGTAALHLALINLGVQTGDEVIVSSLTFSATVNPIIYQNANPVFVDSEKETWNMCPVLLKKAIEERISLGKKPKAIVPVHLYGIPAKIDEMMAVANEFEIPVIEDAAESLGATFDGKHTGTFGAMGVLSFNGNKIITTSGGGALISDNEQFIKHARFLSTQARDNFPYYHHTHIGFNYRMSNIVAGIGRGQLNVIDERVAAKRVIFDFYKSMFEDISGVTFIHETEGSFSSRWLSCILIDKNMTGGKTPEGLIAAFESDNIESRHIWKPMHLQPVFEKFPAYSNGNAELIFQQGVCLPSGTAMSDEELNRISRVVKTYFS
jgi:dTDP-4-amino-4,6-dideoxygalactose transaminase